MKIRENRIMKLQTTAVRSPVCHLTGKKLKPITRPRSQMSSQTPQCPATKPADTNQLHVAQQTIPGRGLRGGGG